MPKFVPINEVVKLPMLGNGDYLMRAKGRLLTWAKYVYEDMNMASLRVAKRELFDVNKRTNSIDMPCDSVLISSVNVIHNGIVYPVFRNQNLLGDLVEVSAAKDCACENKCGYKLCNTIKGYEAIQSVKSDFTPNGDPISFNCIDRKSVDDNGFYFSQTQYPLRVYVSGVWTETILHTENETLCKVDVDEKGCVCDTEHNIEAICGTCADKSGVIPVGGTANCAPHKNDETWIYWCDTKLDWFSTQCGGGCLGRHEFCNIYNISDTGNRLIFPKNFAFDKVLVRYYADVNLKDLQIPMVALDTFIMGLKWWDKRFDDNKEAQQLASVYGRQYALMKFGLLKELNKHRIAEMKMILTPPIYIPSYTHPRIFWNDTNLY